MYVCTSPLAAVPCRDLGNGHSRQSTTINMAPAVYIRVTSPTGLYHLPKKDHCHPKARGDKFFDYHILPTFYVMYLHATYNADLKETERPTSRGRRGERLGTLTPGRLRQGKSNSFLLSAKSCAGLCASRHGIIGHAEPFWERAVVKNKLLSCNLYKLHIMLLDILPV